MLFFRSGEGGGGGGEFPIFYKNSFMDSQGGQLRRMTSVSAAVLVNFEQSSSIDVLQEDDALYYRLGKNVSTSTTMGSTLSATRQVGQMNASDYGAFPTPASSTLYNPYVNDNASAVGSTTQQPSYPVRVPPHQSETRRPTPSSLSPPAYSSGPNSLPTHTPYAYLSQYQDSPYARSSPGPPTGSAQRQRTRHPPRSALYETADSPGTVETETESSDEEDAESDPDPYSYASLLAKHRRNIQDSYWL